MSKKSLNKAMLIGNLGRDPEVRYTADGRAVANFTIATNESWTKDGESHERTEWHKIVAWGKLGEICGEYLSKGNSVYIEGRIQTQEWEDRDGNKRYTTEIVANQMIMLGGRGEPAADDSGDDSDAGAETTGQPDYGPEDDVPF